MSIGNTVCTPEMVKWSSNIFSKPQVNSLPKNRLVQSTCPDAPVTYADQFTLTFNEAVWISQSRVEQSNAEQSRAKQSDVHCV